MADSSGQVAVRLYLLVIFRRKLAGGQETRFVISPRAGAHTRPSGEVLSAVRLGFF